MGYYGKSMLNDKEWNECEMKWNKQTNKIEFMTKGIPFCWNQIGEYQTEPAI